MSTILTETEGFTPVIDVLAKELGLMTAVVYGIVWRYCQMKDKECSASRETIAKHAGISSKTVERHLDKLCKAGYLKDLHPDWKHRPHVYADTGKLKIEGLLKVKKGETESPTSESGETESPEGTTESLTRSDTESSQGKTESLIRIPSYDSLHDSQSGEKEYVFPENPEDELPDAQAVINSIADDFVNKPSPEDLARATASARAEAGGNYAAPPTAGGDDGAATAALVAMYEAIGSEPPEKGSPSWLKELGIVGEVLCSRGVKDIATAADAGKQFGRANIETPHFVNPHLSSFPTAFGIYVGKAKKQAGTVDTRRARDVEVMEASLAAFEERMAARPPPAEDDKVGQAVKGELQLQMTRATFETWVKGAGMACDDGVFVVTVSNALTRAWLENRLATTIKRTAVGVMGRAVEVRFEVTGSLPVEPLPVAPKEVGE